jgi:translocation and assembly module TamA
MCALLLLAGSRTRSASAAEEVPVCPGITFVGTKFALTAVERGLVCGDEDSEGWKDVPRAQARRFLTAFLQQRAFHRPVFKIEGGKLIVDPGPRTMIKRLEGDNLPAGVDLSKRRRIVGTPLTPGALDKVKIDLGSELRNMGYPCPEVRMSGDSIAGTVRARFLGGSTALANTIEEPLVAGVDPGIFRRFEAFRRDRPIDQRLLTLTSNRIVSEALFLNSTYDVTCGTGGVRIIHRAAVGPPRLIRLGVGVDTEGFARVRARWQHSRIGWRASTAEATVFGSRREQSVNTFMRLYLSPQSRLHFVPSWVATRSDEPRFEAVASQLSFAPALTWDDQSLHVEARAGPALEYADTRRGIGPQSSYFQTFNSHIEVTSHMFEYFLREPHTGFHAGLDTASRVSQISSKLTAHRLRLETEKLWNVGAFDPPLAVIGTRGWIGTTMVGDRDVALQELPVAMRFFIGGDADFRGVGPGELGDERGFLSGVYQGVELRAGDVLPLKIQPLAFLDVAMAGRASLHLDPDVYYAPGFGVRWPTFIGAFRMTFARSLIWRRDPATAPGRRHWQFFFSYGREF